MKIKRVLAAGILFLLLGGLPVHAKDSEVRIRVDGMSCPFCAFGLKKKLGEIEALKGAKVNYKEGVVLASWEEGSPFDEERIKKAVQDAGFTPAEISVSNGT